jgi:predicted Abi (CAAX) family protease
MPAARFGLTRPAPGAWRETAALAALLAVAALAITEASGVLGPADPGVTSGRLLSVALALPFPALVEELLFRAPLLRWRTAGAVAASLSVYIAWHPVGALLRPELAEMARPAFLLVVALLGAACTWTTLRSGSILPAVALHWGVVSGWILIYGGP